MFPIIAVLAIGQTADLPILDGLGISGVTQGGRVPAPVDMVQAMIVDGTWNEPHAGDSVPGAKGGERRWAEIKANKDGTFEGAPTQGGYIYATVDSDVEKPMLLVAAGDSMVTINGVPRGGDPYGYGWLVVPFRMKKGHNTFLFSCGRGTLKATLKAPKAKAFFNPADLTVPDVLPTDGVVDGAVPVVNCTNQPMRLTVSSYGENAQSPPTFLSTVETIVPALSVRKVPFGIDSVAVRAGITHVTIYLDRFTGEKSSKLDTATIPIATKNPTNHYKRTFISEIDGSVQYFAVAPSLKPSPDNALILTVHGASVEATNQANAYKSKNWCTIVAPTNRRPYGFDWEDWGRMDAMEVWRIAKKEFPHDPRRQILTGHSMGGHGTWQIGLTYPNEFAAIGPSAGWISFWSYAGGWTPSDPNPVEQLLRRSVNQSDTLLMLRNALNEDIYILHGDKDDNVPVEQAREMKKRLEGIGCTFTDEPTATSAGHEYVYHEQPGAGHWWGDECVDWPPMFELFAKSRLAKPGSDGSFEFVTINPAVSSTYRGVTILQQRECLMPSQVKVVRSSGGVAIQTANVAALRVDGIGKVSIDGQAMKGGIRTFWRGDHGWTSDAPPGVAKGPDLSGPFKRAFQSRFAFVVGTHGTPEENAWALAKARYDAEQWYYRGNGSVDLLTDDEVVRAGETPALRRNLILYGHADMNTAWKLLKASPLQVHREAVTLGGRRLQGDDLATVFLYPKDGRLIGVVAGTGMKGLRYTDRIPYFTSGIAYPDWTLFRAAALKDGSKGVVGAGFFGNDWKFDPRQSAFLASR